MTSRRRMVINAIRRRGWEVRRFDPYLRLEDYLHFVVFPRLGVDCVLDVGAHVGEYGQRLRDAGYAGRLISFEPVAASYTELARRASSYPGWTVHQIGLGDSDEEMTINVMRSSTFSSLREPRHDYVEDFWEAGNVVERREPVTIRRLDRVFDEIAAAELPGRMFMKLDTQGWDLNVLAGAGGILDRVVALQSELSVRPIYDQMPDFETALAAFGALGFDVSAVFPVSQDRHLRLVEYDCVLVRRPN